MLSKITIVLAVVALPPLGSSAPAEEPAMVITDAIANLTTPATILIEGQQFRLGGQTLNRMLVEGELDAVFTARPLSMFVNRAPNIGRLFPNYREVEQDYFRRTRIYPIMHVIGIRKSLVAQHPWLPGNLYKAFRQAKSIALKELVELGWPPISLPWADVAMAEASALMGPDYWRYGVSESAHEIEALIGYSYDQGLLPRKPTVGELFHPATLEFSKI